MGHHVKRYRLPNLDGEGGGRAKPSGGRAPRRGAPERAPPAPQTEPVAPSADDAGTPDDREGRGEAARPRRAERTAKQSSRGGDGGEDAPQPTSNQAGDGPETDPGRAGGRPTKRGAFEAREGARDPRTGRRKRAPREGASTTAEARP